MTLIEHTQADITGMIFGHVVALIDDEVFIEWIEPPGLRFLGRFDAYQLPDSIRVEVLADHLATAYGGPVIIDTLIEYLTNAVQLDQCWVLCTELTTTMPNLKQSSRLVYNLLYECPCPPLHDHDKVTHG